jgi:hypothetical protein
MLPLTISLRRIGTSSRIGELAEFPEIGLLAHHCWSVLKIYITYGFVVEHSHPSGRTTAVSSVSW